MRIEDLETYELIEKQELTDISGTGYLLRHKKTGAKVALISNDDDNKVFHIGFRTPPKDSTGVAHITEHSVLCGSKNYPVKDPFVELVKGSLNTFLNAMTYPDKTVYPVASCNDQDFQNLMHVYLDAVFYPNTYDNESIFRQEGWHYEFDEEGKLIVNGVVYNEMKGAFSSPDDVLEREIMNSLYPDTSYGVESGGDPEVIPELTYEGFLDFHRAFYHPSNSYIYLYGDMDMAEKLTFIDEEYLSKFEMREVDSTIQKQTAFSEVHRIEKEVSIAEGEGEDENTFLSLNYSVGTSLDTKQYIAMQVLDYALCSAPGAPLKMALVERGIGNDVYSICENGIYQPYFSFVAKDTQLSKEAEFIQTVEEVLTELSEGALDHKSLLAAINHYEFQFREADFGSYPKGLMYGLQMMDSWLYDESKPFIHLQQLGTFDYLKEQVENGYFEGLIRSYFLENAHKSIVVIKPCMGLEEARSQALADKLAALQKSMSEQELAQIREDFAKLNEFQEREDSEEDLAKIPLLSREDLKKEALQFVNEERRIGNQLFLYHKLPTNGIGYLRYIFKMDQIPGENMQYVALLKGILGKMDTAKHTYADLNNELNLLTGGFTFVTNGFQQTKRPEEFLFTFEMKMKYLYHNLQAAMELMEEILFTTKLQDTGRIQEILLEARSQMQASMTPAGHQVAVARAAAMLSSQSRIAEELNGVAFYRFVADIVDHFEERKEEVVAKLQETLHMLLRPENFQLDLSAEEQGLAGAEQIAASFLDKLYTDEVKKERYCPAPFSENEGLMTSGQVLYVCRAGNFVKHGLPYTGALRILKVMMGYQYLWVNVRVKGGAYGCMSGFGRTGDCYFVSYRDPNLSKTIKVYEEAADAIADAPLDDRSMTQFLIGTISDMDQPMNPNAKGSRSYTAYMSGITFDMIQKERDEVLGATPEDIRALSKHIAAFMSDNKLVVVGNAAKIKEEQALFDRVENMF